MVTGWQIQSMLFIDNEPITVGLVYGKYQHNFKDDCHRSTEVADRNTDLPIVAYTSGNLLDHLQNARRSRRLIPWLPIR